ncbi:Fungal transcriptional regulatory protein [Cordyceps militaris CM01]|uniref:Fungal transcriptional regulatory protein n=2 Tax=Cordyceps militaris TaxID=73501 RepID=G3J4W1_CORMM|nr:Fungal transcriptional regulatory protein [Cordyceps militaris CM01]ATY65855.1 Fungal transcriptional regulatory [Cordyceps militaris]EGX95928.1 Fungal transcriptional regulatory protein [Cordyceps militaris CM01]
MGSDSRPVCHRCAQIKQACDGNLPCARCVRLSLPCMPRDAVATGPDGFPGALGDMPKARIRRVQTGCLMCKRRKKKCDETKPRCGDCRRLCLDCAWPVDRPKDKSPSLSSSRKDVSSPSDKPSSGGDPALIEIPLRQSQSPSPSASSSPHSNGSVNGRRSNSNASSYVSEVKQNSAVIKRDSSASDGEAISDKISWDLSTSPPSWVEAFTPVSNSSAPDALDLNHHSTLSVYVPQLLPQLQTTNDRALMNHYSTIVSSILSRRNSTSNPYNHYLLPMAQGNDLVLHCILALSANHWRKLQPTLGSRGLYHQGKAASALAQLLPHVDKQSADIALVASLLLCMTELFDGTSEGWKLHLKGAKRLLITLMTQQGEMLTGHYKFLLRLARFLDSAATTSTCRPPLIGDEEAEAATLNRLAFSPDEDDSAVYGIPKELFHLLDLVNTLADKRKTRVDRASEAAFREEAQHVEERINHWSYEYGGLSRAVYSQSAPSSGTAGSDDVLHAAVSFENAVRLRLHQVVDGYELTDPKVDQCVGAILEAVQKIRYGSPLEACVLFPLVMAGGACSKYEHRLIIQDRLLVMERTCGFGYVFNARDLVERVWSRRDDTAGTGAIVNWARIRYEEMHGLVVF